MRRRGTRGQEARLEAEEQRRRRRAAMTRRRSEAAGGRRCRATCELCCAETMGTSTAHALLACFPI